jgi:ArsR family transcriptional regulator
MNNTQAVEALAALAHEHRLGVYRLLVETGPEGLNAGTIAARLKLAPSSLTFHLQQLHRAGLITQRRDSRQLIYSADFPAMNELVGYLTENCCAGSSGSADCDVSCAPVRVAKKAPKKSSKAA